MRAFIVFALPVVASFGLGSCPPSTSDADKALISLYESDKASNPIRFSANSDMCADPSTVQNSSVQLACCLANVPTDGDLTSTPPEVKVHGFGVSFDSTTGMFQSAETLSANKGTTTLEQRITFDEKGRPYPVPIYGVHTPCLKPVRGILTSNTVQVEASTIYECWSKATYSEYTIQKPTGSNVEHETSADRRGRSECKDYQVPGASCKPYQQECTDVYADKTYKVVGSDGDYLTSEKMNCDIKNCPLYIESSSQYSPEYKFQDADNQECDTEEALGQEYFSNTHGTCCRRGKTRYWQPVDNYRPDLYISMQSPGICVIGTAYHLRPRDVYNYDNSVQVYTGCDYGGYGTGPVASPVASPTASPSGASSTTSPTISPSTVPCVTRTRKEVSMTSSFERTAFNGAWKYLIENDAAFKGLVNMHQSLFSSASIHGDGQFLPWHRWYLLAIETMLIGYDPTITGLIHWDWNKCACSGPLASSNGSPFSYSELHPINYQSANGQSISRCPGSCNNIIGGSPGTDAVHAMIDGYSATQYSTMRNVLENGGGLHGTVHCTVGCNGGGVHMCSTTAANDAAFVMHHANIDKIWEKWQTTRTNGVTAYTGQTAWTGALPGSMGTMGVTAGASPEDMSDASNQVWGGVCYDVTYQDNCPVTITG